MPAYRINNKNVLFIHVPKAGGTTIETFLAANSPMSLYGRGKKILRPYHSTWVSGHIPLQHFHAGLLEAMFEPGFFDYVFMVVRDPLERLKSEYRYSRKLGRISSRLPFGAWARLELRFARLSPHWRSNHFRPQADFLCFNAEVFKLESGMDFILKNLSERLRLSVNYDVPHMRRSESIDIPVSATTAARIRKFYASDYDRFDYG